MKESILSASEFKAKCLSLLDEVANGNTLIITKHGRPVAKVSPVSAPAAITGRLTARKHIL